MRTLVILIFLSFQCFGFAQDSLAIQLKKANNASNQAYYVPKNLQLSDIEIQEQFIDFKQLSNPNYQQQIAFGKALSQSFDSVVAFYNYPTGMNLPHYLNTLTFHFAAINWNAPHKIKYSFYLEGFENDWSQPSTSSKAIYRKLPHGNYTLKVKAKGEAQVWSEPFIYTFSIQTPWWHTRWAYLCYFILLLTIIAGILHYWQKRKQEEAEIQRLIEENKLLVISNAARRTPVSKEGDFLNLVHETLKTHLSDENFGIAELCEIMNISRTQLHRKLKALTGLSTSHYLRSLRLEIAKNLLEQSELNVSEVAFKVGFSSATYFSTAFKEEFGYAPREAR